VKIVTYMKNVSLTIFAIGWALWFFFFGEWSAEPGRRNCVPKPRVAENKNPHGLLFGDPRNETFF